MLNRADVIFGFEKNKRRIHEKPTTPFACLLASSLDHRRKPSHFLFYPHDSVDAFLLSSGFDMNSKKGLSGSTVPQKLIPAPEGCICSPFKNSSDMNVIMPSISLPTRQQAEALLAKEL